MLMMNNLSDYQQHSMVLAPTVQIRSDHFYSLAFLAVHVASAGQVVFLVAHFLFLLAQHQVTFTSLIHKHMLFLVEK